MVLHVTADERVSKHPVQQEVPRQVQDSVGHLVDPLWSTRWGEHVEADVLQIHTVLDGFGLKSTDDALHSMTDT